MNVVDNYSYPDLTLILKIVEGTSALYEVVRETPLPDKVTELVLAGYADQEITCFPEHSFGNAYELTLQRMVRDALQIDQETLAGFQELDTQGTTIIELHSGSGDYGVRGVVGEFELLAGRNTIIVESKRFENDGKWKTFPGNIRGDYGTGSITDVIAADIVATGASLERIYATALVLAFNPTLYEIIVERCNFPERPDGELERKLIEAAVASSVEGCTNETGRKQREARAVLIQELINAEPEDCLRYARIIRDIIGEPDQQIRRFTLIANGTDVAGTIAAKYAPAFEAVFPKFKELKIIYGGGIFELATKRSNLSIVTPATDILTRNGATPDTVLEMLREPHSYFYPCHVFYGSKRARESQHHWAEVAHMLVATATVGRDGLIMEAHLQQRMQPVVAEYEEDKATFIKRAKRFYIAAPGMEEQLDKKLTLLYDAQREFWQGDFPQKSLHTAAVGTLRKIGEKFAHEGAWYVIQRLSDRYNLNLDLPRQDMTGLSKRKLDEVLKARERREPYAALVK
ncbi:hypothetical protein COV16_04855 [Candidatus Woesearchaeota archaeon CG10_big_fil_rev_8_21_14_0_10_34_8]|nr:MAG: hypothetical protein COV16_04855 [Candidatus Woesearchaeota archaeon CG10_big_fil_rev_8_21_14_0_10_34_8]